mmetsp:Transcript_47000/g.117217  ORF Transcript_47000/g.117217 Transcript_47000/m.117217 type:complete len:290 (+) Transcript_47000:975-1844(+)
MPPSCTSGLLGWATPRRKWIWVTRMRWVCPPTTHRASGRPMSGTTRPPNSATPVPSTTWDRCSTRARAATATRKGQQSFSKSPLNRATPTPTTIWACVTRPVWVCTPRTQMQRPSCMRLLPAGVTSKPPRPSASSSISSPPTHRPPKTALWRRPSGCGGRQMRDTGRRSSTWLRCTSAASACRETCCRRMRCTVVRRRRTSSVPTLASATCCSAAALGWAWPTPKKPPNTSTRPHNRVTTLRRGTTWGCVMSRVPLMKPVGPTMCVPLSVSRRPRPAAPPMHPSTSDAS